MTEDEMVGWHHRINGHLDYFHILATINNEELMLSNSSVGEDF